MAGQFEGVYTGDEISGGETSMLNAMGSAGEKSGGPLVSPEENFEGSQISPAALAAPGNALPSIGGAAPSSDNSFDCMADNAPMMGD
jgi:hypothetical protein